MFPRLRGCKLFPEHALTRYQPDINPWGLEAAAARWRNGDAKAMHGLPTWFDSRPGLHRAIIEQEVFGFELVPAHDALSEVRGSVQVMTTGTGDTVFTDTIF